MPSLFVAEAVAGLVTELHIAVDPDKLLVKRTVTLRQKLMVLRQNCHVLLRNRFVLE